METIAVELLEPLERTRDSLKTMQRPSIGYWADVWRRLRKNRLSMLGLVIVVLVTLTAILAPVLTPYEYYAQDLTRVNAKPSAEHVFGLDMFGRDLYTRVIYGSRISMIVAYASALVIFTIGVLYGGIAGFAGGKVDMVMMRVLDIISGIPMLLYLILLMVVLGPGLKSIIFALGITQWIGMARMVRGDVLKLKNLEFVLAARVLGTSRRDVLLRHFLPNTIGVIIINLTFAVPHAIFSEAFLSFLGLGVSAPQASWGILTSEAVQSYMSYPHQLLFPALAICITILGFNFLGDGLRDAMDPKLRS